MTGTHLDRVRPSPAWISWTLGISLISSTEGSREQGREMVELVEERMKLKGATAQLEEIEEEGEERDMGEVMQRIEELKELKQRLTSLVTLLEGQSPASHFL